MNVKYTDILALSGFMCFDRCNVERVCLIEEYKKKKKTGCCFISVN